MGTVPLLRVEEGHQDERVDRRADTDCLLAVEATSFAVGRTGTFGVPKVAGVSLRAKLALDVSSRKVRSPELTRQAPPPFFCVIHEAGLLILGSDTFLFSEKAMRL